METILTHFQENATTYVVMGVCILPVIVVTRKYSVPLILYLLEYAIYLLASHTAIWLLLNVAKWFKENSSMRALREDGKPADAPDWYMPFFEFWNTELYQPDWIWKLEIVVAIIILAAMWRLRPMKVQTKRVRRYNDTGKKRMDFSKYNPKAAKRQP